MRESLLRMARLVGSLAAQLFGADLDPMRCQIARDCGVPRVLSETGCDLVEAECKIMGGAMCNTVADMTGL